MTQLSCPPVLRTALMRRDGVAVYMHTNVLTGKAYVGITKKDVWSRWIDHLSKARKTSCRTHFASALRKYGSECWMHTVLETCSTVAQAKRAERTWIAELGTVEDGYNVSEGGDGTPGLQHTGEAKRKIAAALRGCKRSEATRAKLKEAWKQRAPITKEALERGRSTRRKNFLARGVTDKQRAQLERLVESKRGKPLSEKNRLGLSLSKKGRAPTPAKLEALKKARAKVPPHSAETRAKISAGNKGKKLTEEHKARLREIAKARPPRSEATRKKISAAVRARGPVSETTRRKQSEALKRSYQKTPMSEQRRKNISEAVARWHAENPATQEQRDRMAQRTRKRFAAGVDDTVRRKKISESTLKRFRLHPVSDETRRRMGEASAAAHARRKRGAQ